MTYDRRKFIKSVSLAATAAATVSPALWSAAAHAAPVKLKFGCVTAADHPLAVRAGEAADRIREETKGQIDIQVFPNNQLGSDMDTLAQLRAGAVDFMSLSGIVLANYVPTASITGMGFAFKDYDRVWAAVDGELGEYIRTEIEKRGITTLGRVWDFGFRQITSSSKQILKPADLAGFKIRVPNGNMFVSLFQSLGAAPTAINWGETYSALQTKLVDGQENPLTPIYFSKIYEVQKYVSPTNHMWDGMWILANSRKFKELPEATRAIITKHFDEAGKREREDIAKLDGQLAVDLQKKGLVFLKPDHEAFKSSLIKSTYYKNWSEKFDPKAWALLEKYAGKLI